MTRTDDLDRMAGVDQPAHRPSHVRDHFAAHALAGVLAAHAGSDGNGEPMPLPTAKEAADMAYEYADAMLRRRGPFPPG